MSDTANAVQQWLGAYHNKDFTAAERIDHLVRIIDELIELAVTRATTGIDR